MSDVPPPSPPPEPEPQPQNPLEYESPSLNPNRPAGGVPFVVQMLIGFAAFFTALGAPIGVAIAVNASGPEPLFIAFAVTLTALIVFLVLASVRLRWRGVFAGAAIGFGLLLLGCGVCTAIVMGSRFP